MGRVPLFLPPLLVLQLGFLHRLVLHRIENPFHVDGVDGVGGDDVLVALQRVAKMRQRQRRTRPPFAAHGGSQVVGGSRLFVAGEGRVWVLRGKVGVGVGRGELYQPSLSQRQRPITTATNN